VPQKVLCILSHTLTQEQNAQIRAADGQDCIIEQKPVRFDSFNSFIKYIKRKNKVHDAIYVVTKIDWFKGALKRGYDLGKMYLKKLKENRKNKVQFFLDYYLGSQPEGQLVKSDVRIRNMNCKGYFNKSSFKK
jgi:hypothetical protein